jgi:type VI secretion system secreted protein VgrG
MYTQENRLIAIETPLGPDALLLRQFSGTETVSRLFSYRLTLLSENHRIAFTDIIGRNVTLSIILNSGEQRFINGIVASFSQSTSGTERIETGTFSQYTAIIVPWPWLLTRTSDIRIFQELSVPDIIEKIFHEKGFSDFSLRLHGQYERKVYCVQYRETDFNFVSRLMEEEGIFYFFEHASGKHTLVLADSTAEHPPCPEQETARYHRIEGGITPDEDVINTLEVRQEIRVGKFSLNDYNFETPATKLTVEAVSRVDLGPGEREIYDYPAEYEKRPQGDRLANIFMESEEAQITSISGSSSCRAFRTGYRIELQEYFREDMNDKSYVLTEVSHTATSNVTGMSNEAASTYSNSFSCIPHETPFRPQRMTAKPIVKGVQTAAVVGPSGEEIYTDKYGRVKVQFHWDREGKYNENSSCWIRVRQSSAGPSWGSIYVPRIGQEVIVEFIEGDPDRPIITGCVYNGSNSPPFSLPGGGMVMGWKSNSTPGGGGYNEMTLNDTKGKEKITIHGQYDMNTTVEHDQTIKIKTGKRTMNIDAGTNTTTVKGTDSLTVQAGSRTVTVTGGDYSATSTDGAVKILGNGKGVNITGNAKGVEIGGTGKGVTVTGNGGTGVKLSGTPNFEASGNAQAAISSPIVDIGNGTIKIHGTSIELSAGGSSVKIGASGVTIKGAMVNINT